MLIEMPVSCKEFILRTIQTKDGVVAPPVGDMEEIYPWGAGGAMAETEKRRLRFQAETTWGKVYDDWHRDFSGAYSPRDVAIVGVSGRAEQVRSLLAKYPEAKIVVIELDGKKVQEAESVLRETNRTDVKRGRVSLVNQDATLYLPTQAERFDYIGADKVAIHLRSKPLNEAEIPPRHLLYKAVETALKEGGIFHKSDIHARTWRVCAALGFEENPDTLEAIKTLQRLMPVIVDASWTKRDALLWETMDDMWTEPVKCAPKLELIAEMTRRYVADPYEADHPEGMISQLIAITPALGIEARRRQQPDNPGLMQVADAMWKVAEGFINTVETPGVQIALPDYNHFAFRKK